MNINRLEEIDKAIDDVRKAKDIIDGLQKLANLPWSPAPLAHAFGILQQYRIIVRDAEKVEATTSG